MTYTINHENELIGITRELMASGQQFDAFYLAKTICDMGWNIGWHDAAILLETLELKGEIANTGKQSYPGCWVYSK